MAIECFIQHCDYMVEEMGEINLDKALELLDSFDWQDQISRAESLDQEGEDWCPPNIGFVADDGRRLNLQTLDARRITVHLEYPSTRKLLGLFSYRGIAAATHEVPPGPALRKAVELFYHDDQQAIVDGRFS
jgi:hypothetical protein